IDRVGRAEVEQHRIEMMGFLEAGYLGSQFRDVGVAATEVSFRTESCNQLRGIARLPRCEMHTVTQRVAPVQRTVYLHEVGEGEGNDGDSHQGIEHEEQL